MTEAQGGRVQIRVTAHSRAPRAEVFRLLKDGASWPRWSMFDSFVLEREGESEALGAGAIRVFATRVSTAREEVTAIVEGRLLAYRLLSGLPLPNYLASVSLEDAEGGGTDIRWTASFGPQSFARRIFWRIFMRQVLRRTVRDLAREAERLHACRTGAQTVDGEESE